MLERFSPRQSQPSNKGCGARCIVFADGGKAMSEFDESNLEQSGGWAFDVDDAHSIAGRARVRAQLAADIEAFLNQGGEIQEVDTLFRSDPPRKVEIGFNNRSL